MKKTIRVLSALGLVLAAVLGLSGNALALSASGDAGAAFDRAVYHGDPALCAMDADEARALAAKLGELIGAYNDAQYTEGFVRRAALVDMGSGVPALFYYEGVATQESPNPLGPGLNGTMDFDGWKASAWEFIDGELVRFMPGWYYDGYMVYEDLSGNGRSGAAYAVPIRDGVMELLPDEDGYLWIEADDCVAWYEWALGSWDEYGEGYDGYENMYAGENGEYREVLENPGSGSALGIYGYSYVGLGDAVQVWLALDAYAAAREAADASDPTALVDGYGEVDVSSLPAGLLRGYARTLRELPDAVEREYSGAPHALYNFATLLRGGDGTVLLWVVPAIMDSDWWGQEQYFTYSGASFIGQDHRLFGWDGKNVRDLGIPGLNQIRYWPEEEGLELRHVYYGTDVGGQPWELMYGVEDGGLAAQPQWCHASGFLYTYELKEAGLIDWIPTDDETRRDVVRSYFDEYMAGRGEWPLLPLDWDTFTSRDMLTDAIDFGVYSGDYLSFHQAHETYNAQYDYTYFDPSAAGSYADIGEMPGRWLPAGVLADRLDAMADLLESSLPPEDPDAEEPDTGEGPGGVEDEGPEKDRPTGPEDERDTGRDRDEREDREEEKKDFPTGLVIGLTAGTAVLGGGGATTAVLLSKKRRGKAGRNPAAQASFCTNCGAPLTPGASFCTRCGTKL